MLLAVDIGNSAIKAAVYELKDGNVTRTSRVLRTSSVTDVAQFVAEVRDAAPLTWHVASVHRSRESDLHAWVDAHCPQDSYCRLTLDDLPLTVQVEAPQRIGIDRLASAVAANAMREVNRAALIIDAGTAITIDLVTPQGIFQGGVILAGPATIAAALHQATDALPLVDPALDEEPPDPLGRSTETAIRSGLYWGCLGAVEMLIRVLGSGCPTPPNLFITGGAGRFLALHFADGLYAEDLVLRGLALAGR
jgi:type III pantothenate kinase